MMATYKQHDGYQVYQHVPCDYHKDLDWFHYGDLDPDLWDDKATRYIMPDLLSGSDYSGTLVELSNHDVFLEEYGNREGVNQVLGGHGTFAVAISLEAYDAPENEDMRETLASIQDYPIIDDDAWCAAEQSAIDDAWVDWIESDLTSAIEKSLDIELDIPSDILRNLFHVACDDASEYPVNECGSDIWVDVEKVAAAIKVADVAPYAIPQGDDNA